MDAIHELKTPTSLTKVRSFQKLCNEFRQFIPHFVRIESPLRQIQIRAQLDIFSQLNSKKLQALNILKNVLITPPVLALPDHGGNVTLYINACNEQIGYGLLQKQPGDTKTPISYLDGSFTKTKHQYVTTQ